MKEDGFAGHGRLEFDTPGWSRGAIFYQIFVDRFFNGGGSNDVKDGEYTYMDVSTRHKEWNDLPESFDVANFHGGDLEGVIRKLDYLESLSVEAIYLNPVFCSPSNHKYDTEDYYHVDPHFGGNEALERLCKEVHRRGMKIILDGVFNHCSDRNPWTGIGEYFRRDEKGEPECWWGNKTLPKLNYDDCGKLVDEVMEIAKFWLREPYRIDGWRLDVAADLGHSEEFNHSFWKRFRNEVKSVNPDALILAEHYGDASAWLKGDEWDSIMNYDGFMEPVSAFLTGMEKHSDALDEDAMGDGERFKRTIERVEAALPRCSVLSAMNELDNHDHSRFLTRTNHVAGRLASLGSEAATEGTNICFLRQAQVLQFTLSGAPTIYYGDEAGVTGFTDPDSRRDYPWGKEDQECLEFCRGIAQIHRSIQTLKTGDMKWLAAQKNLIAYARIPAEGETGARVITIVHTGEDEFDVGIPVEAAGLKDGDTVRGLLYTDCWNYGFRGSEMTVRDGMLIFRVKPHGAYVLADTAQPTRQ